MIIDIRITLWWIFFLNFFLFSVSIFFICFYVNAYSLYISRAMVIFLHLDIDLWLFPLFLLFCMLKDALFLFSFPKFQIWEPQVVDQSIQKIVLSVGRADAEGRGCFCKWIFLMELLRVFCTHWVKVYFFTCLAHE